MLTLIIVNSFKYSYQVLIVLFAYREMEYLKKEGRESVRDDEWHGRSKEVRTPELIGPIKNFMYKDRL